MKPARPVLLLPALALLVLWGCPAGPADDDDDASPSSDDDDSAPLDDDDSGVGDDDDTEAAEDSADIVTSSFPGPMDCNTAGAATVTMRNTGSATWTRSTGYKLGAVDDSDPFYGPDTRVWLPEEASVSPGATWTFEIALSAPGEPGTYTTDWRMVHETVTWFGETGSFSKNSVSG